MPSSPFPPVPELCRFDAAGLQHAITQGLSVSEVVSAHLDWIEASDGPLNAFIHVDAAGARAAALEWDRTRREGLLAGIPLAVKDLTATAGVPTTQGSLLFRDHVPTQDDVVVARLKRAGGILIGKTNTPEFGFGARCSNALKASTATPHDLSLSSGGSSGGSAAAVAAGQVLLAQGTDFGGSVRTPAAFCGAVGLRPTPGLIPNPTRPLARDTLASHGILTRCVADAGRMLEVLMGFDPLDPTSALAPLDETAIEPRAMRIAWSQDLGIAPVAQEVRDAFACAIEILAKAAPQTRPAHPDCRGAMQTFAKLRAPLVRQSLKEVRGERELLSPTVRWNLDQGQGITADEFMEAEADRSALTRRFAAFFRKYDVLVTPAAALLPFPHEVDEVREIDGAILATILDYLAVTSTISLVGFPCLVLPAWTSRTGLPIGLQFVAPPLQERRLLAFGEYLERECGFHHRFAGDPT
jgi:amidase